MEEEPHCHPKAGGLCGENAVGLPYSAIVSTCVCVNPIRYLT